MSMPKKTRSLAARHKLLMDSADSHSWRDHPVAVLTSGGLDSAILAGTLAETCPRVTPIYVRFGLVWEAVEERILRRFLAAIARPSLAPLVVFEMPIASVYGKHWSTGSEPTPDYESPDEAVFLPGRNLLLAAQASIWCRLNGVSTLAMGVLGGNPFPDSTSEFFSSCERTIQLAVGGDLRIVRPFGNLKKVEDLRLGQRLPLGETLSCIRPRGEQHCGACNKCAERQKGFAAAGLPDPTKYAEKMS